MSRKSQRTVPVARALGPRKTPVIDTEVARVTREVEVHEEFWTVAARLAEVIHRRLEEARRGNAKLRFGPDVDREAEDLKANKAALIKVIAGLEGLKKSLNLRLEDLRWFRKMLHAVDPDCP